MKINVITVLNTINYGSALQTLATQLFFEKRGFDVEFVDYIRKDQSVKAQLKGLIKSKPKTIIQLLKKPARIIFDGISIIRNDRIFRGFLNENIHLTNLQYGNIDDLRNNTPMADFYCTGSDQMWNSKWNNGIEESFFLEYAPEDSKRIAFSTSIGLDKFEENEEPIIKALLEKYDFVTVREISAKNLLEKIGIQSNAILDPTLLVSKDIWKKYMSSIRYDEPYLLIYQLHLKHDNATFDNAALKISKEKNLKIVRVTYSYADRKFGEKKYCPPVFEFLSLINNASYVVTDSFHGTAFSINLNKQFAVVYPDRFSTRMDNILRITSLEDRRYTDNAGIEKLLSEIDFTKANKVLESERNRIDNMFDEYFSSFNS